MEAYARYAISANRAATFLGWFRAVMKKYPDKPPGVVLADLVRHTPGEEGKWFAAAKDAKLFDGAVALANATPCDPKTLTRAAGDFARTSPMICATSRCVRPRVLWRRLQCAQTRSEDHQSAANANQARIEKRA